MSEENEQVNEENGPEQEKGYVITEEGDVYALMPDRIRGKPVFLTHEGKRKENIGEYKFLDVFEITEEIASDFEWLVSKGTAENIDGEASTWDAVPKLTENHFLMYDDEVHHELMLKDTMIEFSCDLEHINLSWTGANISSGDFDLIADYMAVAKKAYMKHMTRVKREQLARQEERGKKEGGFELQYAQELRKQWERDLGEDGT